MTNDSDDDVSDLVARCRTGDQAAAAILFRRHVDQLTTLVRRRISQRLSTRVDAEDVLQSAYRSFFRGLEEGKFEVEGPDELWSLLATIATRKLYRKVKHHSAQRRSILREEQKDDTRGLFEAHPELIAELPTPSEAVAAVDDLEAIMLRLNPQERIILEMRLAGYTSEEIAQHLHRTTRTVRRCMERVREECRHYYGDEAPA